MSFRLLPNLSFSMKTAQIRTGGTSSQLNFGSTKLEGSRNQDKVADIEKFWHSKRRSVPPSENPKKCTRQAKNHEIVQNLLHKSNVLSSPAPIEFKGKYSAPPNPDKNKPNPHKRYNMEFRPHNLVTGVPTNKTCFNFYRNN